MAKGWLSWVRSDDKAIIDVLEEQAENLLKATSTLVELITQYDNLPEYLSEITDNEHQGDTIYRNAIAELFETNDPVEIIKLKEIYETLEGALDRCADVADVIEDITLKYT